ncbi:MAG: hypothetical protein KDD78_07320 [Caldilineaceae bacterium]|nr:hypothetical protein [Caldilineaceae bacterium]
MNAKWTLMIYMAGDNNLSEAGEKDLSELRSVGSTKDVHVVVEFDRRGSSHESLRYHVEHSGVEESVVSLGETDCGDPATLLNFVRWSVTNYPAERYALVLWNHGNGWKPDEIDRVARVSGAADYSLREAGERAASHLGRTMFRTSLQRIFEIPTVSERAICSDDGSGHSLDTLELGNVLQQIATDLGRPLDVLGMDACLMSNLEVAYQVRKFVRYIVASEEVEPNDGWPYDRVLQMLVAQPDRTTEEIAADIAKLYVRSYVDRGHSGTITQAALNMAYVVSVCDCIDKLCAILQPSMKSLGYVVWEAKRKTSGHFFNATLWDIGEYCRNLIPKDSEPPDAALQIIRDVLPASSIKEARTASMQIINALDHEQNGFVVAEGHSGPKAAACKGVTIYHPPALADAGVSKFYPELAYAQEHKWLAYLQAYHS